MVATVLIVQAQLRLEICEVNNVIITNLSIFNITPEAFRISNYDGTKKYHRSGLQTNFTLFWFHCQNPNN